MTLKDLRRAIKDQIKLVATDATNIPQAESVANLAGKMLKAIQLEIDAELMSVRGDNLKVIAEVLGASE